MMVLKVICNMFSIMYVCFLRQLLPVCHRCYCVFFFRNKRMGLLFPRAWEVAVAVATMKPLSTATHFLTTVLAKSTIRWSLLHLHFPYVGDFSYRVWFKTVTQDVVFCVGVNRGGWFFPTKHIVVMRDKEVISSDILFEVSLAPQNFHGTYFISFLVFFSFSFSLLPARPPLHGLLEWVTEPKLQLLWICFCFCCPSSCCLIVNYFSPVSLAFMRTR